MDDEIGRPATEPPVREELEAMASVANALEPLSDGVRGRVIHWAAERFGVGISVSGRAASSRVGEGDDPLEDGLQGNEATFAELFDRLAPRNDEERVLAAMYWVQVVGNQATVQSLDMTKILTDLGHRVDRIRTVLPGLQGGRPALVLQVSHGAGRQGRRVVKLSHAGIRAVETALAAGGFGSSE